MFKENDTVLGLTTLPTRAGILVAKAAASTVKRVAQELGGKPANILLPDVDFPRAVAKGMAGMMGNSGQSCNAPIRMFVPRNRHDEAKAIAKAAAEKVVMGVNNDMTIAREEIFGPVLAILPYADEADAVRMASDTPHGLAAYVQSADVERARRVARADACRHRGHERPGLGRRRPVRRLQAVRQRPRVRQVGGMEGFTEVKATIGYDAA